MQTEEEVGVSEGPVAQLGSVEKGITYGTTGVMKRSQRS